MRIEVIVPIKVNEVTNLQLDPRGRQACTSQHTKNKVKVSVCNIKITAINQLIYFHLQIAYVKGNKYLRTLLFQKKNYRFK